MDLQHVAFSVFLAALVISVQVIAAYRVGGGPLVLPVVPWVLLALAVAAGVVAVGLSAIRSDSGVPLAEGFGLIAILLLGSSAALFTYRVVDGRGRQG